MTRAEHLAWAKARALECLDTGDIVNAWNSFVSDLQKHEALRGHVGLQLGMQLYVGGFLGTPEQMREFIEGFQ